MIVVTRHRIGLAGTAPDPTDFLQSAEAALQALAARPGFLRAQVARAIDDAEAYVLITEWQDVGSYRRALSNFDVKIAAVPLLSTATDEPSAFEVMAEVAQHGVRRFDSDRAADADSAGPL